MSLSDTVMLNLDDKSYKYLTDSSQSTVHSSKVTTFGLGNDADINPKKYQLSPSIPGDFNMYNSLAALAVSLELGISYEDAKKAIHTYQTPVGRQEIIVKNPFTVMIDFAHTPHAFQALLSSLRKEYSGRIFHVFGSAGQRDKEKRPVMGKISSQYTDIIILTAEDPRDENVETISNDIAKGIPEKFPPRGLASSKRRTGNKSNGLYKIPDRREAIETALSLAEKGDLVIITGKGHEQSMNFGKGEEPWSDHKVVNDYLKIIHDK